MAKNIILFGYLQIYSKWAYFKQLSARYTSPLKFKDDVLKMVSYCDDSEFLYYHTVKNEVRGCLTRYVRNFPIKQSNSENQIRDSKLKLLFKIMEQK